MYIWFFMLLSLQQQQQQQSTLTPPHSNTNNNNSNNTPNINIPATSPQHSSDKSDSGYVDYMNLYIKNLDSSVTNNDLFNMFRIFGRIVSARVMSNPQTGQSKGYGFVSYDKSEDASAALKEMNGKLIGAKQLIVAYHEPKKPRQEKQQPGVGGTTPILNNNNMNDNGNHSNINNNNNHNHGHSPISSANAMPFMNPIGTPVRSPHHNSNHNNNNTSAASAAVSAMASVASGTTNPAAGMGTPYSSHDTRHPYDMSMPPVPINMPSQVNGLGIDNVDQIAMTMKSVGQKRPSPPHPMHRKFSAAESNFGQHPLRLSPPFSTSPMSGASSTGPSLASLASGLNVQPRPNNIPPPPHQQHLPQHQQNDYNNHNNTRTHHHHQQQHQQQQQQQQTGGRPTLRRKGSLESVSSVMTESSASMQKQRLMEAVMRCGDYGKSVSDIVEMLLTLKRKERSLCLFNQDFLKDKIQLAVDALETFDDEEEEEEEEEDRVEQRPIVENDGFDHNVSNQQGDMTPLPTSNSNHSPMAVTPSSLRQQQQPQRVSKAIPIVAPPPASVPTAEPVTSSTQVAKSLSPPSPTTPKKNNNNTNGTSNSKNGEIKQVQEVEKLLSSLDGKPTHEKKQQLGDRLFPLVKATGTKQAPKVTIRLLDSIDLHELAHLMYDKNQLKAHVEIAFASLTK
ncbi:hypothetical protein INT45_004925 [Circinella minor]|uniref:Polyadenylate-binding protein, cytoplasmic and nuclear n=1 Tax=Circinella minor TaxID=1195481 RepID=A0A8H7RWL7_9FUNG|nr:hypothetical protein INT45_004925 [Circinella minor]